VVAYVNAWTDLLVLRVDVAMYLMTAEEREQQQCDDKTSALYGRAKMNKPLQIACLHVSEDKGRSIGLVFVIRRAANKARAQSHSSSSSNASAGSGRALLECAGRWRGIAGLVV
jgi:hypothetical protein